MIRIRRDNKKPVIIKTDKRAKEQIETELNGIRDKIKIELLKSNDQSVKLLKKIENKLILELKNCHN